MHWNVPHYKSYVCDRQLLFRHCEQADLELEPDQLLPDTVLLLLRPDQEEMSSLEQARLLLKYWRRLFHARIHQKLESLIREGVLTERSVRERVAEIGRTEFEEVRQVLVHDRWQPETASDMAVYVEFAAVYLELRYFAASLLPNYFPGIRDFGKIEALLSRDVEGKQLYDATRLEGASDPVQPVDSRSDDTQELYWKLVRLAQQEALQDNLVGAAILRMRASRVATAAQTLPTRMEAEKDIAQLGKRLQAALHLTDAECGDWTRLLIQLLEKADQGIRPMEARLLGDLLLVCQDHEEEIYTLDLVEYVLSGGKRPIKRPLPSQRQVRIAQHLRAALSKLTPVRLSDTDRGQLTRLIQHALSKTEDNLRARFRPVLSTALNDVGLKFTGPLEKAAFEKIVAELLDRISSYGYLTFAELRDTFARNQLKLRDLSDPEDFVRGDSLMRLDRRLASLLDGVYRPSEFYVRWLERFTSLKFGTLGGRLLTRWVTLPLASAWLVLFVLGMLLSHLVSYRNYPELYTVALVLMGPAHQSGDVTGEMAASMVASLAAIESCGPLHSLGPYVVAREQLVPHRAPSYLWHMGLLSLAALFSLGLMHSAQFRGQFYRSLLLTWKGLHHLFWTLPLRLVPIGVLTRLLRSWGFQLLWWYLVKPGLLCGLIYLAWHPPFHKWYGAVAIFILVTFLLNSRLGRATSEAVRDAVIHLGLLVRSGLLPGLFRLITQLFKQVLEAIEYVLFRVDEWLRFRSGDGQVSLVVRTVAGALWFPIAFLSRFYMVVLIEPMLNPVKLPVTSLAAKVMYPIIYTSGINTSVTQVLMEAYVPGFLARPFVEVTVFLLPDAVAFLIWEMKENWNLYRANRGASPRPAAFGSHGETVRGLLQPGFHSGTVPRLYSRLRAAERTSLSSRNWNAPRRIRGEIEEVAHAVQTFVSREMVWILRESSRWSVKSVAVQSVGLGTNRIRIELEHLDHPASPAEVEMECHQGWLVAGIATPGWIDLIPADQRRVLEACLAYLYARSDVDLVREQVRRQSSAPLELIQLTERDLLLFTTDKQEIRVPLIEELHRMGSQCEGDRYRFPARAITWTAWEAAWQADQQGQPFPELPGITGQLLPPPPTTSHAVLSLPASPAPVTLAVEDVSSP
ncbi:MAG: hypothetical protein U0840_12245 [Gemmataceae bacterium]